MNTIRIEQARAHLLEMRRALAECRNENARRAYEVNVASAERALAQLLDPPAPPANDDEPSLLRTLLVEGGRNLTLEQTRRIRHELRDEEPTQFTAHHIVWAFDVETDEGGEGEVTVSLPRDRSRPGTLTWRPKGQWVDANFSQLEEPIISLERNRDSNGGKAKAAELLASIGARR